MLRKYRVLLVSSSGGVLLDLLALEPWWSQHDVSWALVKAPDTQSILRGYLIHWIKEPSATGPFGLLPGFFDAVRLVKNVRPQVIISAGSGVAITFFLAARLMRIPTFWLETFNFIRARSLSGRICSRLASEILVQRPSMLETRPGATVLGELY
jgi:UDP-N-acetylglucosamine:LPS N-acetylglucosamine transferase